MNPQDPDSHQITILDGVSSVRFQTVEDFRGNLCVVDGAKVVGFPIKRVYWLYGVPPGAERAGHAHRALRQCYIAVSGSVRVRLDNCRQRREVTLNRPNEGLFIGAGIWRELVDFTPTTVLLVLASEEFDEADYIRDHEAFRREYDQSAH